MCEPLTEGDVLAALEARRVRRMVRLGWHTNVAAALEAEAHYDSATLPLERARARYRRGARLLRLYRLLQSPIFPYDHDIATRERTRLIGQALSPILQVSANFPTPDARARLVCLGLRATSQPHAARRQDHTTR